VRHGQPRGGRIAAMADLQFRATGVLLNPHAGKRPASRARSQPICLYSCPRNSSWLSTLRPPGHSGSSYHQRLSPAPTRWSN